MGFSVTFQRKPSQRFGGMALYSCILECTNFLFGETVTVALIPSDGSQPWYFRDLKFSPGTKYEFSKDTVDWDWYQDDVIAVLDDDGKVQESWRFHKTEYGPGECPDCHGTKRCRNCNGRGFFMPRFSSGGYASSINDLQCQACSGTGVCQTCDIMYRKPRFGGGPSGLRPF